MLLSHEPSPEFLPYKLLAHAKECVFSLKKSHPYSTFGVILQMKSQL